MSLDNGDDEAVSIHGYGFAAGTRITTEHGLIPIEAIPLLTRSTHRSTEILTQPGELSIQMQVASRGESSAAQSWVNSGVQETVRVKTRRDYAVRCSPNRPFLVLGPRLTFGSKRAGDLQPGDLLCLPRRPRMDRPGGVPMVAGFQGGLATAQLAGLMSGRVSKRDRMHVLTFATQKEAREIGTVALEAFGGGIEVSVVPAGKRYELELAGAAVDRFMISLSRDGEPPLGRYVPEALFRVSPVEAARFCLGWCRATSGTYQRGKIRFIEFAVATRQAAADLKLVLLQLIGVASGRIHAASAGGFFLRVAGVKDLGRFFHVVEQPNLEAVARTREGGVARTALVAHSGSAYFLDRKLPMQTREIAASDYFLEPVRGVLTDAPTRIYHLTVAKTHACIANGFMVCDTAGEL